MHKNYNKINLIACFFCIISYCFGYQNNSDNTTLLISDIYLYKNQANYELAIKKSSQLLEIAEKNEDKNLEGMAHLNLGEIHFYLGRVEQAIDFLSVAETEFKNGNDYYHLAITKVLEARVLASDNSTVNTEKINQLLLEAQRIFTDYDLKEYLGNVRFGEGIMALYSKNYAKAIELLEKALPIKNKDEEDYITNLVFINLGEAYLQTNQIEKAKNYVEKAQDYADIFNYKSILLSSLKLKSEILEREQRYPEALKYAKEYEQKMLQFYNVEILQKQEAYANESEIAYKNRLIESINQKNRENNEKLNKSNLTSIFTSALLIVISLLTVSLYRNNKIKLKTNELLVKKNNELLTAKENAERAMKAKTQFLSTVSHELRTPLYAVTGLTHLLLQENPTENQKEHLKSLKFSGEYLLTFINDILQINKIEAKKLSIQHIPFNLEEIMSDVINSLTQTSKESNNEIELIVDNSIPSQMIGDPLKLSQIFINLVGNAIKFTENGKVVLQAKMQKETETHCSVYFAVEDNGIGISEEVQKNIFESFSQGSIQINRKYGGTGLGLNIVKSLLELLKSEIHLKSELGHGSTFYFEIEFEKAKDMDIVPNKMMDDINTDDVIKNLHLLLVEDNKINQVITKKMLMQKNITCDIAENGYAAIENAKNNTYDAILMDIHMPGISGLKATKEIRKFNKTIPIIALTAISLDENTDDFYEAGCNDIVTKPFKPDEFYKKIAKNILENLKFT